MSCDRQERKEVKNSTDVVTDLTLLLIPRTYVTVYRLPTVRTAHIYVTVYRLLTVRTAHIYVTVYRLLTVRTAHIYVTVYKLPTVRKAHLVILHFAHSQFTFRHPSLKSITSSK
jgi:hypothetical protein